MLNHQTITKLNMQYFFETLPQDQANIIIKLRLRDNGVVSKLLIHSVFIIYFLYRIKLLSFFIILNLIYIFGSGIIYDTILYN